MQRRTRQGSGEGDEALDRGTLRRRPPQSSVLLPAAVLLVLIAGAVVLARVIAEKQDAAAAAASEDEAPRDQKQYFSSVPDEAPPAPKGGPAPRSYPRAPSGLAESNPDWGKALEAARVADLLFAEAQRAKQATDHAEFQLKGEAAKASYEQAILLTAEWEEKLLEEYGERDPQVREIQRIRDRWIDRLDVLRKTTGR